MPRAVHDSIFQSLTAASVAGGRLIYTPKHKLSITATYQLPLDPSVGKGGILNVVNDVGGSSTIANPDVPVTVTSYP